MRKVKVAELGSSTNLHESTHEDEWSEDWFYTRGGLSGKTERGDATLDQWTDDDSERLGRLDKNAVRQGANDQTCR